MNKEQIKVNIKDYPSEIRHYLKDVEVYDCSSSKEFQVLYLSSGHYLKSGKKNSLFLENKLTRQLHKKMISVKVIKYASRKKDFLLTEEAKGKSSLNYLDNPHALIKVLAYYMKHLHSIDTYGFPFSEIMNIYFNSKKENYNINYALKKYKNMTKEDALIIKKERMNKLKYDSIIHGDFCLPNIILNNFLPSAMIDLGNAGIGDHHIDIYWLLWSLEYNLKTDKYNEYFLELYGKENVDEEILELIAALEILG